MAAQKKVFFFTFFGLLRFSVFFTGLCAPTSRSRMSNIFRDSESFGFWSFLTVFLPTLPKVRCPIFLEIQNPWGKVMERSGLRYEHFCLKIVLNRRKKKSFFLLFFWSSSVFGLFYRSLCPHFPKSDVQYF